MSSTFFIPAVNIMGIDCLDEAMTAIRNYGFRKALIVTDAGLAKAGVASMIAEKLALQDIDSVIYDGAKPNPNVENVEKGLALLQESACDFVVSLGGGSPHDCAKGIALCATNGGHIGDYEGVDQSAKPQLPLVAINTTAGTASEMTRFCIITDETRHVKMAIVDRNVTPLLSVNDPALMVGMPKGLTAATGMDALTHAIESYVSKQANPISQALALQAIKMICTHLPKAFFTGSDLHAREQMLLASFLAGVAFAQSKLGNVHAISHTFGGVFNIPHGIANATLLPYVIDFNLAACPELFRDIALAMGENVDGLNVHQAGHKVAEHVMALNQAIGIPATIKALGVDPDYMPPMARDSMRSGNVLVNPRLTNAADIERIISNAWHGVH